jgi:hypothetical protein
MQLQQAQRKRAKIKLGLQGPSGSGKTYSALLLAYGLCNDWSKIAVIDTENHSASLYAHLGAFNVVNLQAPYTPELYEEAINTCVSANMEVVIIDSITHEWECLLDFHSNLSGNSFTNWAKVTPRHNRFVNTILQAPVHIISTIRTKQDYVLVEKNNKQVPEKVGLKSIQRDGVEYELTLVFDLDIKNHATASKDRTGLFFGKPEQKLTVQVGKQIRDWCDGGAEITEQDVTTRIGATKSLQELLEVYKQFPQFITSLQQEFEKQKRNLILNGTKTASVNNTIHQNGTTAR